MHLFSSILLVLSGVGAFLVHLITSTPAPVTDIAPRSLETVDERAPTVAETLANPHIRASVRARINRGIDVKRRGIYRGKWWHSPEDTCVYVYPPVNNEKNPQIVPTEQESPEYQLCQVKRIGTSADRPRVYEARMGGRPVVMEEDWELYYGSLSRFIGAEVQGIAIDNWRKKNQRTDGHHIQQAFLYFHETTTEFDMVIKEKTDGNLENAREALNEKGYSNAIFSQALTAVQAVHAAGYAHGSIAPRSFFIAEESDRTPNVLLGNFDRAMLKDRGSVVNGPLGYTSGGTGSFTSIHEYNMMLINQT